MFGFNNDDEECLFHRRLSYAILYLSPIVVAILTGFRPPTYGKHVTVRKSRKQETSASSTDGEVRSNSKSTSSLRKRRGPSTTTVGTTYTSSKSVDDKSKKTSLEDCNEEKQQKEKRHWLGPLFPASWSWVFFESPCWIWVIICLNDFYRRTEDGDENISLPIRNRILLGWFSFHYFYRSLWYPLVMMKTTSARIPFGIIFFAWSYCCVNGYLQARYLTKFSMDDTLSSSMHEYQFWSGILCILIGFYINFTSDRILQRIKLEKQRKNALKSKDCGARSSSRYAVPYGGFFEYVSSPHYFGELMEWTGFCIASNFSLASFSFVVWTAANLVPRAIHTHKWYNETFVGNGGQRQEDDDCDSNIDYSQLDRKVIIPFIF